jgi:hypothetical protein
MEIVEELSSLPLLQERRKKLSIEYYFVFLDGKEKPC